MSEREDHDDVTDAEPAADMPEASSEDSPMAELEARAARAEALEAQLLRMEADFVNESKRLRRLAENDRKYAIEKVVIDLIPVIDALHSAGVGLGESEAEARVREGLDLVGRQLLDVLLRHGVAVIEAEGVFDPNLHEALYTVPSADVDPQTIVEVLRPGFTLHGRVVRPAEVAVAAAPPSAPSAEGD